MGYDKTIDQVGVWAQAKGEFKNAHRVMKRLEGEEFVNFIITNPMVRNYTHSQVQPMVILELSDNGRDLSHPDCDFALELDMSETHCVIRELWVWDNKLWRTITAHYSTPGHSEGDLGTLTVALLFVDHLPT